MPKASRDSIVAKKTREKSVVARQEEIQRQREVYADAILEGKSQTDAARIAGYHPTSASNVMRQEDVQLYLAEAREEIQDLTTIKRLDVLNIFMEAISMARTLADPAQMINGADKVAKMMGYYAPEAIKLEVQGNNDSLAHKFKQLTDEELYQIASQKAKLVSGTVVTDVEEASDEG